MKYKLLACDLDGTLLDDNSNVSAENLNAIDEMVKLGVEFAICTGRTYDEIPKVLLDNKSIRYIIYSDGSVILDKNKKKNIFEPAAHSDLPLIDWSTSGIPVNYYLLTSNVLNSLVSGKRNGD